MIELGTIGEMPVTGYVTDSQEDALGQVKFHMTLLMCPTCELVQLDRNGFDKILREKVYGDYQATYEHSLSRKQKMRDDLEMIKRNYHIKKTDRLLEIGCNDGSGLEIAKEVLGCEVMGIEMSSRLAKKCQEKGFFCSDESFSQGTGIMIGKVKVIIAMHVLEHAMDLPDFMRGLRECMDSGTILMLEVPDVQQQVDKGHWEGFAHPHLYYFTEGTLKNVLEIYGMQLQYLSRERTDGGSLLVIARKNGAKKIVSDLTTDMWARKKEISDLLNELAQQGKKVYAFGAGKGMTILNMLGINNWQVQYVLDDDPTKQGKWLPGCGIEVINPGEIVSIPPDYILMLTPTHTTGMKRMMEDRFPGRAWKWIDIIPEVKIEE